jgi:excisionase family DNA binding protein
MLHAMQQCRGMAMELVSLPEAAQRLGVSVDTVKRRLRRGEMKGQRVPRPQGYTWLIELQDNQPDSMADSTASSTAELDAATIEVLNLREMLVMAQSQIATQQEELASKNKQIEQLHVLLQQAQAALPAPRGSRSWWQRLWRRG